MTVTSNPSANPNQKQTAIAAKPRHRATETDPMNNRQTNHPLTSNLPTSSLRILLAGICTLVPALLLSGCAMGGGSSAPVAGAGVSTLQVTGRVHGGQQPVVGATIQLYTVGTSGLGSASTPMLTSAVTTLADGSFTITGQYSCSTVPATQVYITATGGNPGAGTNSALTMAAALGPCSALTSSTFIWINEVTTVAATYALAPFATDILHIGATGSNPTGLLGAFSNAATLANTTNGNPGGVSLGAGVTVPANELNTLANIIAACVNTNGPGSTACTTLFSATGATETFGAALGMAKNPGAAAITALFNMPPPSPPFVPNLTSQPSDFTVALTSTANGTLATPYGIAIDASGNAWVTNESGSTISEIAVNGNGLGTQTATGLSGAQGVAIDRGGNVWVANTAGNSVVQFAVTLGVVSGVNSFNGNGISAPTAIALDSASNVFIANFNGNSVTELNSSGVNQNGSPFTGSSNNITVPTGIAIGLGGGAVYVTSGNGYVVKLSNSGVYKNNVTDNALQGPVGVALTSAGQIGVTGSTTGSAIAGALGEFTDSGSSLVVSPVSPVSSGLFSPAGIASDGVSFWVANSTTSGGLAQFAYGAATPTSPTAGYGSLNTPVGVAVDPSGSVWTTNSGSNTVSKFIGVASSYTTPIAANVGP